LKILKAELVAAMTDQFAPAKLAVVEHLPYLVSGAFPENMKVN
jgi:hypothetical protein